MRILGVTPSAKDISWAKVEGSRKNPKLVSLDITKQKFPEGKEESETLYGLYQFASSFLADISVEKVIILQAGTSKYGNPSTLRIKVEAMFQIACVEKNIPVEIIHPNTLNAQIKKFETEVGKSPEVIFNNSKEFKPKPYKDTVLTAWIGLN